MKKRTIALIASLTLAGHSFSQVIYSNDFTGAAGKKTVAAVGAQFQHQFVGGAALDGEGHLVAINTTAGNTLRVNLGDALKNAPAVKLSWSLTATRGDRWTAIGFHGENVSKVNENTANGGPWLFSTVRATVLQGGTGVTGSKTTFQSHKGGDVLNYTMIYRPATQSVDLMLNGKVLKRNEVIAHKDPSGAAAAPVLKFLQFQIWESELETRAVVDSVSVEILSE